jgi:alpha-ketoglutarate-dependent taurine dioxygenase
MQISAMPEWTLAPVRRVEPGPSTPFPRRYSPADPEQAGLSWLRDNRAHIDTELLRHGAVLLRGFEIADERGFEQVARTLSGELESRYGDLVKRASAEFIYDATWYPKDRAILFHNEGSHTPELPTRQFFYCSRANFTGGETPIVDSRELYRALPREILEPLVDRGLVYVRNFMRGVDVSWQDFFRTQDRADVERRCAAQQMEWCWKADGSLRLLTRAPAVIRHPISGEPSFCNQILLHHVACLDAKTGAALRAVLDPDDFPRNVQFGDGSPIPDAVVAEILRVTVAIAVRFTWQRGDVLMLDNLAAAHARSPFDGDRQILVAVGDVISRRALS